MSGEEYGLPKTTVLKLIKERLPTNLKLSTEAGDIFVKCCDDFVHLLASTSNAVSEKEKKNTIQPEHVLVALEELGYMEYLEEMKQELEKFKEGRKEAVKAEKERKAARNNKGGMSDQELLELQQKLFMEAKNSAPGE